MNLNSSQKAKTVLFLNAVVLFLLIISTPYFIQNGTGWISEETVEAFFLTLELLALLYMFSYYDKVMQEKEEEAWLLNVKLKSKERELLGAFQYLGKVNVQISMIRSLLEKMKVPSTKSQLREVYAELLRLVCSVTGKNCAVLRIINLETRRTIFEQMETVQDKDHCQYISIGNNDLANKFRNKDKEDLEGYSIFYSEVENFYLKAFVFVPNKKKNSYNAEECNFLKAVANQCEVVYLLFNSRYYKSESSTNY